MLFLRVIWAVVRALVSKKANLVAENLALRQQLVVLRRKTKRPRLLQGDRVFWLWLARSWTRWRHSLLVVKPETVVRWHRQGFKYYWTWKSRQRSGRPTVAPEVRELIRKMSRANPLWGAPRIHGELLKLGIDISQASVGKYMIRPRRPPSPSWRAFLDNHVFPWDTAPRYMIPDRDGIYDNDFTRCAHALGIKQVLIAPHSPWQNP